MLLKQKIGLNGLQSNYSCWMIFNAEMNISSGYLSTVNNFQALLGEFVVKRREKMLVPTV